MSRRWFTQSQERQVNDNELSTPSCLHVSYLSLYLSIISLCFRLLEAILHSGCLTFRNMANRPHVPKFGDWTEDAPFTVVFEKASKSKKNMNVANPNEYPDMNPNAAQNRNMSRPDQQPPNHNVRPRHERFNSRDETEFRPSPAHNERNNRVRSVPPTPETYNHQTYGGGGRSMGNPTEINRRQSRDHVPARPIRNLRGQSSERVATIPPFPGTGSNMENQSYTLIFDKVKEDRNQARSYNGTDHSTPTRPIIDQHHQPLPSSPKGCCFPPWSRKGS
ncbi:defense protein-like protein [Arabidopsis thaliana]|uniref:Defense protein-like protein n=2 Tax=Arabidopsis thaliana TaxID=3702 RepID=A0A1P8BG18_ARATH|nr:defense protein-like protein [Arabidopsis thaliana]ANM70506.1 defense protein-like protein [Arabidopsis thaliana]|eukprot:NP_001332111.1 defense protein-like protein [Arabidopsis thaliana]